MGDLVLVVEDDPANAVLVEAILTTVGDFEVVGSDDGDEILQIVRERPVAVMLDDVLFIHGGVSPEIAGQSIETLNETVRRELGVFDRARNYLVSVGILPATAGVSEPASGEVAAGYSG